MNSISLSRLLITLIVCVSGQCFAQDHFTIHHHNPTVRFNANTPWDVAFSEDERKRGYAYRILVFNDLKSIDKSALVADGITLLEYLPQNAFYAKVESSALPGLNRAVIGCFKILPEWRLDIDLASDVTLENENNAENTVAIALSLFAGERANVIDHLTRMSDVMITEESPSGLIISIPQSLIGELAEIDGVSYISYAREKATPVNLPGKTSHGSNYLDGYNSSGVNYTGNGITVLMTDDGSIGEHIDFKGRYDQSGCFTCSSDPLDSHGDHVAGTIMGAGNLNPIAKGMAVGINFFVEECASGFNAFWNDVPNMYSNDSLVLTSRSYRNGCGGAYTSDSRDMDEQMRLLPNLLHVCAAANEGSQDCGYGVTGWGNISDAQQAGKNPLVVGALNKFNTIAGFSSRGPLADGRIKPDICGVGVSVLSTQPDNNYASWDGTSMSTPGVTGTLAQLYESFKVNNNGQYPTGALMKAIVMNTADDLGNKGPDFIYGYGKINARKANRTIENQTYFIDTLSAGVNESFFINVPPNVGELKVMLYWPDWEASVSANYDLVNNLNMQIIDPNSNVLLPWVLDHTASIPALSSPAVPGIDNLNNAEQITMDNPVSGTYEITVDGFSVPQGPQPYYIVYEFNYDEIHVNYPNGMEGLASNSSEIIRWDAITGNDDFLLEYTLDNGSTWNTIGTAPAMQRYFSWNTPSGVATGLAKVRVTRNSVSDSSDTTFSIINPPTNLAVDWACPDSLKFSWTGVAGAIGYEVSMLGAQFMEVYDTVLVDSIIIQVPATDTVWLSVSTLGTNNAKSRRAIAINKNPGEFNCTWSAPYAAFDIDCEVAGEAYCFTLFDESVNTDATSNLTWYFPGGTPAVSSDPIPQVCYDAPGVYDVALVVDNGAGTDSIYQTAFIQVDPTSQLPYFEGFEAHSSFINNPYWSIDNPNGNAAFQLSNIAALSGSKSARLYNFSQIGSFADELISGPIDLSGLSASDIITLSFRYAYRKKTSANDEWLKVYIAESCADAWVQRKTLHGDQLSSLTSNTSWAPTAPEEWTTVHMTNVTSSYFSNDFRMKFRFESDGGNNFYLDNINLYEGGPSDELIMGLSEDAFDAFSIFPNPADDELNVQYSQAHGGQLSVLIKDLSGKLIFDRTINSQPGTNVVVIDSSEFASGMYLISLVEGSKTETKRVVIK